MKFIVALLAAGQLTVAAPTATAAGPTDQAERAAQTVIALAQATRAPASAPPALAVVVTRPGVAPTIYVDGVADMRSGALADADTPFYIASMTKAYVGLIAAELDARGVFDLDQTMSDVWPGLVIPDRDPSGITFRQLLSHQAAIDNDVLTGATAYVREVAAKDYGAFLALTTARPDGFRYDNLGYNIYGAALELKTGRHWRDWLREVIIEPLGLDRTGPSVGNWTVSAAGHEWIGDGLWQTRAVKADDLMHAAGGLMTSPNDMAKWLAANANRTGFSPEVYATAQSPLVAVEADQEGIACQGYSLGWRTCLVAGEAVLLHGGGYTGARSSMAIVPRLGVGIAVLANSDGLTGYLGGALTKSFLEVLLDADHQAVAPDAFGQSFADLLDTQMQRRVARLEQARADEKWEGWAWKPDPSALDAYVGQYRADIGIVRIDRDQDGLRLTLGEIRRRLEPAAPDLFGASSSPIATPEEIRFRRDGGRVTGLEWGGDSLVKLPDGPLDPGR